MQLEKLIVSGFKSISTQNKQTIEFEDDVTAFIGHNGTGKSSALEALNKLFAIDRSLRVISADDFYLADGVRSDAARELFIEAWFHFPTSGGNAPSIPPFINGLTVTTASGKLIFRVRLEAKLSFDYNPNGDVEEDIWVISGDIEEPLQQHKHRLSSTQRNSIQVNYIPANRDPLSQLKYTSRAALGRLLKAIKWSEADRSSFEHQAQVLNTLAAQNPALSQISSTINQNWNKIYKGRHLNKAELNFPVGDVDEVLRLLQLQFMPNAAGNKVETSRLSDGQKSLVYFSLIKALFDIDKHTRESLSSGVHTNFDAERMNLPIFSLIALEEPENHLSPHYLGRVVGLIKDYGSVDCCQSIVSTHSSSLVSRVEPHQIRHFRLDIDTKSTRVAGLTLPSKDDDKSKFISEAVKSYPEIYFSKIVILVEGDSEQVIIPKLLDLYNTTVDSFSISVVPLGGRHVNHFWRLLEAIKIPYVTLLDFDIDRNGGGFGRMKYAIEQLNLYKKSIDYIHSDIVKLILPWDNKTNPNDFKIKYVVKGDPEGECVNIVQELEKHNVFFSSPLDIDYSMICAFPDVFCQKDKVYNERGPSEGKVDEDDKTEDSRKKSLINAVLKKGNSGIRYDFGENWEKYFTWYRYRFLSNKSKPASHVRMFSKIEEKYTPEEIKQTMPAELTRLIDRVVILADKVVE